MKKTDKYMFLVNKLDFFKKVPLFYELKDEQIKHILQVMEVENFGQNEYVMREGTIGNKMFILLEGQVEISKSLILPEWLPVFNKQEKTLLHFSDSDHPFFGEMVMLGDTSKRSASIITKSPCIMASITRNAFEKVAMEDKDMGMRVYRNMAGEIATRLRRANKDILKLTTALSIALEG